MEQEKQAKQAIEDLKHSRYRTLARPNQLPPEGDWRIWLVISGRGFGKTFLGGHRFCWHMWQDISGGYGVTHG